ncbi:DedA family protein [soil metagenome]
MSSLLSALAHFDLTHLHHPLASLTLAAHSDGTLWNWLSHLDDHLTDAIKAAGGWSYALMFAVIFAETGFVIFPFLPGDSFLFALGVLCDNPDSGVRIYFVIPLLIAAAILGNCTNFLLGRWIGPRIFRVQTSEDDGFFRRILARDKLDKAHAFFTRHGGKAITFAQFVPFMRCLIPFVAGMGRMDTTRFLFFNWLGAIVWVGGFVTLGFLFGKAPYVREYSGELFLGLAFLILLIILTPPVIYMLKSKKQRAAATLPHSSPEAPSATMSGSPASRLPESTVL